MTWHGMEGGETLAPDEPSHHTGAQGALQVIAGCLRSDIVLSFVQFHRDAVRVSKEDQTHLARRKLQG